MNMLSKTDAELSAIITARTTAVILTNLFLSIFYTPKTFVASAEISFVFSSDSILVFPQAVI